MEKITLAIPVHDIESRWPFIKQNIGLADGDERVSEVVLSVEPQSRNERILRRLSQCPKVKVFFNEKREFVFRNKYRAIERSTNSWVIILDSDNQIDAFYLSTLYKLRPWDPKTMYQPEYLYPMFDARRLGGERITRENVARHMDFPMFRCLLNAMNYFVNRGEFLEANRELFDTNFDPKCADSLYINYNMLKNGCTLRVVKDLRYDHRVHDGSFYKQNAKQYKHLVNEIEERFRKMS